MNHSPAPWSEDPEGLYVCAVEDASGSVVCDVYLNNTSYEDNMRLILKSPNLLQTLESILAACGEDTESMSFKQHMNLRWRVKDLAIAAIERTKTHA